MTFAASINNPSPTVARDRASIIPGSTEVFFGEFRDKRANGERVAKMQDKHRARAKAFTRAEALSTTEHVKTPGGKVPPAILA